MKKLLIATSALALTAAPALADSAEANIDEMTIEELNQWQLSRLASPVTQTPVSVYTQNTVTTSTTPYVAVSSEADVEADIETEMDVEADAAAVMPDKPAVQTFTIAEAAMADERFTTLVKALKATDLAGTLMQEGPYTVFAPTNAAFEKLDAETKAHLMSEDGKADLKKILKAHVIEGKYYKADIAETGTELNSIGRTVINLETDENGMIKASDTQIISADMETSNGVIHVIDAVIVPEWVEEPKTSSTGY